MRNFVVNFVANFVERAFFQPLSTKRADKVYDKVRKAPLWGQALSRLD